MKPRIIRGPASRYADRDERIVEISNGKRSDSEHKGCLISLRNKENGELEVCVYRRDPGVVVIVGGAA